MSFEEGQAAVSPGGDPVQAKAGHGASKPGLGTAVEHETSVDLDRDIPLYFKLKKVGLSVKATKKGELAEATGDANGVGVNLHAGRYDVGASAGPKKQSVSLEDTQAILNETVLGMQCEPTTALEVGNDDKGPSFALKLKKVLFGDAQLFGQNVSFDLGVSLIKFKTTGVQVGVIKISAASKVPLGDMEVSAKLSIEVMPDWTKLLRAAAERIVAPAAEAAGAEAAASAGAEAVGAEAAASTGAEAIGAEAAMGVGAMETAASVGTMLLPFAIVAGGAYAVNNAWESGYDLNRNAWRGAKRIYNYCTNFERSCRGQPAGDGDGALEGYMAGTRATMNQAAAAIARYPSMRARPLERMREINAMMHKEGEIYATTQPSVKASHRRSLAGYASGVPNGHAVLDTILSMSDPGSSELASLRADVELDLAILERLGVHRGRNALLTGSAGDHPRPNGR